MISLPRLSGALELAGLPDSTFIGLEVQIPYYSERIDAVLYGHDAAGDALAVLVELKKPKPNPAVIERLMKRFIYTAGATGLMQIATLVIMAMLTVG